MAVAAFLEGKIEFCHIFDTVINTFEKMTFAKTAKSLEEIIQADRTARKIAGLIR